MPWILPAITAATGIYGAVSSANAAKNAANQAAQRSQVDIDKLNEQTKAIARQNALDSAELEKRLTPLVPQLRDQSLQGILSGLRQDQSTNQVQQALLSRLGSDAVAPVRSQLLNDAIDQARKNLALGGQLPQDVQNLITRNALAKGGMVAGPGGGLNLGRDLTTRDLGLTSLDLMNQRLGQASNLAGQETALGGLNANIGFGNASNLINIAQLLRSISDSGFQRQLAAGQFGQSIQQPMVGLDPSAIANIAIANQNAQGAAAANRANIYGQQSQNFGNFAGQMLGYGLLNYNNPYGAGGNAFNSSYQNPTQTANYFGNYNPGGK